MPTRHISLKPFSLALLLPALAACSGTATQDAKAPVAPLPVTSVQSPNGNSYTLLGAATAGSATLTGGALLTTILGGNATTTSSQIAGTQNNSAGTIIVNDRNGSFSGANTPANRNTYTNTTNTRTLTLDPTGIASTYDFVRPFTTSYPAVGGGTVLVKGVMGVTTASADIPTSGTAGYTGVAEGKVYTVTGTTLTLYDVGSARTTVTARFGGLAPSVDVVLDQFTNVTLNGNPAVSPLGSIEQMNSPLNGNYFSGGTVTWRRPDGTVFNLVGTTAGINTGGGFFYGYDPVNNIPDEVGGVSAWEGTTGGYYFGYIAD